MFTLHFQCFKLPGHDILLYMGNKRRIEKLQQLLEDADVSKMKSYIRKHRLKVNRVVDDETARTLLHLSCLYGRDDVIRYLLKKGADASIVDKNGDTALHLAAKRAISGEKYAFQDLVLPLLHKCPDALSVKNKSGDSARYLVQIYEKSLKGNSGAEAGLPDSSSNDESTEEERWHQKLKDEVEHEYGAWASYEEDYYQDRDEETYEGWVERIRREQRSKYHQNIPPSSSSGAGISNKKLEEERRAQEFQKKLERDHEQYQERMKMKMMEKKQKNAILNKTLYEKKWTDLFSEVKKGACLSFCDIPWPDGVEKSADDVRRFLFCDFGDEEASLQKKYLRSQQVRWHPDKFLQKFGESLLEGDRDRILEKVKSVSQVLNHLADHMSE